MPQPTSTLSGPGGFSLIELSVSLIVIGLLASAFLGTYTAQRKQLQVHETERQLEEIRETLIGFAIVNGRLPCPAVPDLPDSDTRAGQEDRVDISAPCNRNYGVIPWATLGIRGNDYWGRRFSYFVSIKFSGPPVSTSGSSFSLSTGTGSDNAGTANIKPSIASGSAIASDLPAVVLSHGPNGFGGFLSSGLQIAGAKGDELENANNTQTFIAHNPTTTFDDQLIWIVGSVLKSKLLVAGKLP